MLDEAAVVQALGFQDIVIIAPTLNMRQREWVDLLADNAGGLTVTEIMRPLSGNKLSCGQPGRTLQNDLLKVKKMAYAEWLKDGSARRHQLRAGA